MITNVMLLQSFWLHAPCAILPKWRDGLQTNVLRDASNDLESRKIRFIRISYVTFCSPVVNDFGARREPRRRSRRVVGEGAFLPIPSILQIIH